VVGDAVAGGAVVGGDFVAASGAALLAPLAVNAVLLELCDGWPPPLVSDEQAASPNKIAVQANLWRCMCGSFARANSGSCASSGGAISGRRR
jgi:hypothetical protein